MYKIVFYFFVLNTFLFAYVDNDMDGVPDSSDKCPYTPLTDLVDLSGCGIKKLVQEKRHFDIVLGQSYTKKDNTNLNLSTILMDYYYQSWSFQLFSSFYRSTSEIQSSSGINDTYLNIFYLFKPFQKFSLRIGGGLVLPTYNTTDNNIDYSSSLYGRYKWDNFSFIMGIGYGKIGDNNSENIVSYNNTLSYNTGLGYNWNEKLYSSIAYAKVNSIVEGFDDLEILSLYTYYNINAYWFSNISYRYGLVSNGSQQTIGVNLGYYW